jgi:hypothetical protein
MITSSILGIGIYFLGILMKGQLLSFSAIWNTQINVISIGIPMIVHCQGNGLDAFVARDLDASVMDSHPNIEVRLFNPFSRKSSRTIQLVTRAGSVTRRMHNKPFTVDNQATILDVLRPILEPS